MFSEYLGLILYLTHSEVWTEGSYRLVFSACSSDIRLLTCLENVAARSVG